MTWTVKMADARYDGYEEGFDKGLEDGLQVGIQQGLEQGAYQTKLETARTMLLDNFPIETISKYTNLPLEVIQSLMKSSSI